MSEGPGGPQGATAGGTLAMRMLSQQAMVASQMNGQPTTSHCTDVGIEKRPAPRRQAGR